LRVPPKRRIRTVQELTDLIRLRSPRRILGGPFQGLIYGGRSFGSMHLPKLLGTYERELSGCFSAANLSRYDRFVNIGCAEGYYANGIAYLLRAEPGGRTADVTGVDLNNEALTEARRIADWNGLQVRFVKELEAALASSPAGRMLVICDVDGAETHIMAPSYFPVLNRTDFIVELHGPPGRRAVLDEIRSRFASTHKCVTIEFEARRPGDFPSSELGVELDEKLKIEAMDERRVTSFCWLSLEAKPKCQD
jgi:SAM-dependent methyltransferase